MFLSLATFLFPCSLCSCSVLLAVKECTLPWAPVFVLKSDPAENKKMKEKTPHDQHCIILVPHLSILSSLLRVCNFKYREVQRIQEHEWCIAKNITNEEKDQKGKQRGRKRLNKRDRKLSLDVSQTRHNNSLVSFLCPSFSCKLVSKGSLTDDDLLLFYPLNFSFEMYIVIHSSIQVGVKNTRRKGLKECMTSFNCLTRNNDPVRLSCKPCYLFKWGRVRHVHSLLFLKVNSLQDHVN